MQEHYVLIINHINQLCGLVRLASGCGVERTEEINQLFLQFPSLSASLWTRFLFVTLVYSTLYITGSGACCLMMTTTQFAERWLRLMTMRALQRFRIVCVDSVFQAAVRKGSVLLAFSSEAARHLVRKFRFQNSSLLLQHPHPSLPLLSSLCWTSVPRDAQKMHARFFLRGLSSCHTLKSHLVKFGFIDHSVPSFNLSYRTPHMAV